MRKLLALLVVLVATVYFIAVPEDFAKDLPYDGLTLSTEVEAPPPPMPAGLDLGPEDLLPPPAEEREAVRSEDVPDTRPLDDDLGARGAFGEEDESVPVALPGDLAPVETDGTPIQGRVVDVEGRGLPGVRVRVQHAYLPEVQSSTDPEGAFRMTPKELRGELILATNAWVLLGGRTSLREGMTEDYLLVVAEPVHLRGVVVDEAGLRISGARVHGTAPTDALVPFGMPSLPMDHEAQHGFTNARGEFSVGPVPLLPGTQLEVRADGYAPVRQGLPEDPRAALTVVLTSY